jgi:hypothetical protein
MFFLKRAVKAFERIYFKANSFLAASILPFRSGLAAFISSSGASERKEILPVLILNTCCCDKLPAASSVGKKIAAIICLRIFEFFYKIVKNCSICRRKRCCTANYVKKSVKIAPPFRQCRKNQAAQILSPLWGLGTNFDTFTIKIPPLRGWYILNLMTLPFRIYRLLPIVNTRDMLKPNNMSPFSHLPVVSEIKERSLIPCELVKCS